MISHRLIPCLIAILTWLSIDTLVAASLRADIGSRFIVEGEQTILEFILTDADDTGGALVLKPVEGLQIAQIGFGAEPRITYGRRREYVFRYAVSTYQPGIYTIPSATLDVAGGTLRSEPIKLRVVKESDLEWRSVKAGDQTIRYAAAFHVIDDEPFVNEVLPTELKLYVPSEQRVEDWGIPELERDGVAAWRFEPRSRTGRARLLGRNYYAVSYPSTLSATRAGPVSIGPANLRLITVQTSLQQFGQAFFVPVTLEIPELPIRSRELPPGAPEGFEDAIGQFSLSVTTTDDEVREGDPVNVNIVVRGKGNLDTLNVPKPVDSTGWKLYPTGPQQSAVRRSISGFTTFRQFMRPLAPQSEIPAFQLVYFDPELETYATLQSNPIPLTVVPTSGPGLIGASPPPELPLPVEQMTDILAIADRGKQLLPATNPLPGWWWQLIPAAVAIALLVATFRLHFAPRLRRDPVVVARRRDLRQLEKAASDEKGFYRAAGHFVERWLGSSEEAIPLEVLARRDETCFTPDADATPVPRSERQRILRELRKLVLPLIALIALLGTGTIQAEEPTESEDAATAYEESRYSDAARLWLESGPYDRLPADTLYNIGNAAYRLGSPGEAALYWRRALVRDNTHAEARQNLRFFERKFGSLVIKRPDYQHVVAVLSLDTWKNLIVAGGWLIGLAILVFPATRPGAGWRIASITSFVTAPLIIAAGILGWYYYPDDAKFASLEDQAVVVVEKSVVRTDASRNAPLVIEAPAGSLCEVLDQRRNWVYIAFSNKTRGWIPASEVEKIIPDPEATVPEPRKPEEEGQSA